MHRRRWIEHSSPSLFRELATRNEAGRLAPDYASRKKKLQALLKARVSGSGEPTQSLPGIWSRLFVEPRCEEANPASGYAKFDISRISARFLSSGASGPYSTAAAPLTRSPSSEMALKTMRYFISPV